MSTHIPDTATLAGQKWSFTDCPSCNGTGSRRREFAGTDKIKPQTVTLECPDCRGRGYQRSFRANR